MASVSTEICNSALITLGQPLISDIDDASDVNAVKCKSQYTACKAELLEEWDWKFALGRKTVAVNDTEPEFGYSYRYEIPTDALRVVKTFISETECTDWIREGGFIFTNQTDDELQMWYVKDEETLEDGEMPRYFTRALGAYVAYKLSLAITPSAKLKQLAWNEYLQLKEKAKGIDAMSNYVEEYSDAWVNARNEY